jgi:hypothetical protein
MVLWWVFRLINLQALMQEGTIECESPKIEWKALANPRPELEIIH